jgi:hypothetical protein
MQKVIFQRLLFTPFLHLIPPKVNSLNISFLNLGEVCRSKGERRLKGGIERI